MELMSHETLQKELAAIKQNDEQFSEKLKRLLDLWNAYSVGCPITEDDVDQV